MYHVNGDGSDGGVVYSEMEAHPYEYTRFAFLKALYKDYGFGSNVGGGLENLRKNTTRETVNRICRSYLPMRHLIIL